MIRDTRDSGDRRPFSLEMNLGESVNLTGATLTFSLSTLDLATDKIDAQTATATDITLARAGASAPALSYWRLEYHPTSGEVTVTEPTDYLGKFKAVYAGSDTRYYPPEGEWIRCSINLV